MRTDGDFVLGFGTLDHGWPPCGDLPGYNAIRVLPWIVHGHKLNNSQDFIPREAHDRVNKAFKEKGIDIDLARITPQDLEEIVSNLDDMTVEVDGKDKVRIFCE